MDRGYTDFISQLEAQAESMCVEVRKNLGLSPEPEGDCKEEPCKKLCPFLTYED